MNAFKRLAEVVMEKYSIYVPLSEVVYETVFLKKEEMDEHLLILVEQVVLTLMKFGYLMVK